MGATAPLAVKGGIGDFLQCLPFMLANPGRRYLVASHLACATQFFAAVGSKIEEVPFSRTIDVELCPRQLFFDSYPFVKQPSIFNDDHRVLGVHLGGSDYSLSVEKRFGFPSKALPASILDKLLLALPQYDFLLFGSLSELVEFSHTAWLRRGVKFICNEDVTVSLSHVAECSAVIGSDSAFKTMSAMLRIPTVVWVGDYKDTTRDDNFIDPYVKACVMSVFRYGNLEDPKEIDAGVRYCVERLKR